MIGNGECTKLISDEPLYSQVRNNLKLAIAQMEHGQMLLPERQLAREYDVDRVTIRRAMQDLVREGFVVRYRGRGTFVSKQQQDVNKTTGLEPSNAIGVVMPNLDLISDGKMFEGIEKIARQKNFHIIPKFTRLRNDNGIDLIKDFVKDGFQYIITTVASQETLSDHIFIKSLRQICESGVKVVTIDRDVPESGARAVILDKFMLGYMATEHLIMQGHRKICFVSTAGFSPSGDTSYRGHKTALTDYGIEINKKLSVGLNALYCAIPTQEAIEKLLHKEINPFTAIVCAEFSMTYGTIKALENLGISIPSEMAVVGTDIYSNPELSHVTHILQPVELRGEKAVELLFEEYDSDPETSRHKHNVVLKPKLVIRKSCGAAK